jgi:hypothetical protein
VEFGGGAVVALLDRDLLRDELLLVQHGADADREDRQAEREAIERCREAVDALALGAEGLVLPRPEDEDHHQGEARDTAQQKPIRHCALGALLGLGALDGEAGSLEDGVDAVELGAEANEFLARHLRQLLVGGLAGGAHLSGRVGSLRRALGGRVFGARFVAHARDPTHIAAAMTPTIPMIHAAMPSDVGPKPPSP